MPAAATTACSAAAGDDWIDGGDGDDWLDGGLGGDTIYGGGGDDVFVFGLHEDGDLIFDHEGRNTLRIAGADPAKVQAGLHGDDLVVTHDGAVLATVDGYAGHAANYAGIDLGQGVRPISDFMADPGAAVASAQAAAGDWLAGYVAEPGEARRAVARALEWARGASGRPHPATDAAGAAPSPARRRRRRRCGLPAELRRTRRTRSATADLWLPVDDLAGTPADMHRPERHGEERTYHRLSPARSRVPVRLGPGDDSAGPAFCRAAGGRPERRSTLAIRTRRADTDPSGGGRNDPGAASSKPDRLGGPLTCCASSARGSPS